MLTSDWITFDNLKIVGGIIGAFPILFKVWEHYIIPQRKKNLKLNIEIYESLKTSSDFGTETIKKIIEKDLKRLYRINEDENPITNIILGIYLTIIFGWWSIDIFLDKGFSAWIILTGLMCFVGLSLMFKQPDKPGEKGKTAPKLYFKFGVYDIPTMKITFITIIVASLIIYWIYTTQGLTFWIALLVVFIFSGIVVIKNCFKRID
mgnify:CR=1 FL=1